MARQLKRKRVQSFLDSEDVSSHQPQPSLLSVDSLMRSILSKSPGLSNPNTSTSQPSSSTSTLLASYQQANLKTNRGLKGKRRTLKLKSGRATSGSRSKSQVFFNFSTFKKLWMMTCRVNMAQQKICPFLFRILSSFLMVSPRWAWYTTTVLHS